MRAGTELSAVRALQAGDRGAPPTVCGKREQLTSSAVGSVDRPCFLLRTSGAASARGPRRRLPLIQEAKKEFASWLASGWGLIGGE
jgi:hypothetical protein